MHPAYSVIFFTTASGAGYGLLVWLGLFTAAGLLPQTQVFYLAGLALALGLVTAGLLSSSLHLGRPERAWRAFLQWRSSWLSREGVAAVITYIPAGVLGLGSVLLDRYDGVFAVAGVATAVMSLVTVYCTGMIYASLPTIRTWHHHLVTPVYLVLALASGAVLLTLLMAIFASVPIALVWLAVIVLIGAWMLKTTYWLEIDQAPRTLTTEQATGLGRFGRVRLIEAPHTRANFVMREMGYQVARKHAQKLRSLAVLFTFFIPSGAIVLILAAGPFLALVFASVAAVSMAVGLLIERWLFFAEAEHVSMLFYGRGAA